MKTDNRAQFDHDLASVLAPENVPQLISQASDIVLWLDPVGRIQSVLVNPHHRSFGQLSHWQGFKIDDVLAHDNVSKLHTRLALLRNGSGASFLAVELNHIDTNVSDQSVLEFPVRYSLHKLGKDGSVLMMGRDLRPIGEVQQKLVAAQMALERDYEAQRELDTRYRVLMEATRDAVVVVSVGTGRVVDVNTAAAVLMGAARPDLIGAGIAQEFEGWRRGEFLETMASVAAADSVVPVELMTRRSQKRLMALPTMFRAAGERLLLCRLEVAEQAAEPHDELGDNLLRLYNEGADGIVFTDRDGTIRAANEAFLNLTDSANMAAVKGRSLGNFLVRGEVDLRVILENVRRARQMRVYSTKLTTAFMGQVAVEMSAAWLNDRPAPGVVLVIRDATRADTLRRPGFAGGEEGANSVMELVGSSTLKDIVAETSDVVEKMCIETAVELTRNNRVAAAEMLGLSRQSLYVKLRKYGLLNKSGD